MYAPLWVKSNFSFLQGASHPDELVEQAHSMGLTTMALTDRDGVYGIVRAHTRARELGFKVIHGAQLNLDEDKQLVALCQSRKGYGNLCQLISRGRLRSKKGESCIRLDELVEFAEDLIVLCPEPTLLEGLYESFGMPMLEGLKAYLSQSVR